MVLNKPGMVGLAMIAIVASLAFSACKREETQKSADASPPAQAADKTAATPEAAAAEDTATDPRMRPDMAPKLPPNYSAQVDAKVTRVQFANAGDEETGLSGVPGNRFSGKDSVYLQIRTTSTASDYLLTTRWKTPDGSVLAENSRTVPDAGGAETVFSLAKPDGWESGTYTIEIEVNGRTADKQTFVVR